MRPLGVRVGPCGGDLLRWNDHDQFRGHLTDFVSAYNFGRRLKTLKDLTPYEFICKRWTAEPRFMMNPLQKISRQKQGRAKKPGCAAGSIASAQSALKTPARATRAPTADPLRRSWRAA